MVDIKVSDMPEVTAQLSEDDYLYTLEGGVSKKAKINKLPVAQTVATLAELQGLSPDTLIDNKVRKVETGVKTGDHTWIGGDQSALVTADPDAQTYTPPTSDPTGASGVWQFVSGVTYINESPNINLKKWIDGNEIVAGSPSDGVFSDFSDAFSEAVERRKTLTFYDQWELTSDLTATSGQWSIKGDNRRGAEVLLDTGVRFLTVETVAGSYISSIELSGFRVNGDTSSGVRGVRWDKVNFSKISNVEFFNIGGRGLELFGLQDCEMTAVDVRKCGTTATSGAFGGRSVFDGTETNSVVWFGGDFERNLGHQLQLTDTSAWRFFGTKFHGRTTADDATPLDKDLCFSEGDKRLLFNGCQWSNARRNGLYSRGSVLETVPHIIMTGGNTFTEPANYTNPANGAFNINIDDGKYIIDDNEFFFGTDASYVTNGADIKIGSSVLRLVGENLHETSAAPYTDARTAASRSVNLAGDEVYVPATGNTIMKYGVNGESYPRLEILGSGNLRLGNGSITGDVVMKRNGVNALGIDVGSLTAQVQNTPSVTAAQLADVTHEVNTSDRKKTGWQVWESTNSRIYVALAGADASAWKDSTDGTANVTPS